MACSRAARHGPCCAKKRGGPDVWLPAGLPWLSASDVLPRGGSPVTGNTSAQPASKLSGSSSLQPSNPPSKSPTSAGLPQSRTPESVERQPRGPALALRPLLLTCLCLMTLPACSWLKPKPPEPQAKCPIVQCLDRALQVCKGVDPMPIKTCADAVLIASDALGEVVVCQESHAALIRCVEQFNHDHGR